MHQILGHDQHLQTFQKAIELGRMHHAWILSGPAGIGKSLVAKAVATALLDPTEPLNHMGRGGEASTQTQRLIEAGTHPDLHIIHRELSASSKNSRLRERKQMNIPLDLLRETLLGGRTSDGVIHEAAAYRTPVISKAKAFIIDEAERLDLPGQNSLLKTLEEPPPATYIFLVTNRPERLLPTIRSRCQHMRLGPLSDDEMDQWLVSSEIKISPADTEIILSFCEGAPGVAHLAIKRDLAEWIQSLKPLLACLDNGQWPSDAAPMMAERIDAWAKAVVSENPRASKDAANREGAEMMLRILADHARRRFRTDEGGLLQTCVIIDRIAEAEQQFQAGLNLKHVLEALTAEWASPLVG